MTGEREGGRSAMLFRVYMPSLIELWQLLLEESTTESALVSILLLFIKLPRLGIALLLLLNSIRPQPWLILW